MTQGHQIWACKARCDFELARIFGWIASDDAICCSSHDHYRPWCQTCRNDLHADTEYYLSDVADFDETVVRVDRRGQWRWQARRSPMNGDQALECTAPGPLKLVAQVRALGVLLALEISARRPE